MQNMKSLTEARACFCPMKVKIYCQIQDCMAWRFAVDQQEKVENGWRTREPENYIGYCGLVKFNG